MRVERHALGRVLFGDFLLHEQEKVTRAAELRGSFALSTNEITMDSGFRLAAAPE